MRIAVLFCALLVGCFHESGDPVFEDAPPVDATTDASFAEEQTAKTIALLRDLEARLPGLLVDGQFPIGTQTFTPGPTCCAAGGVRLCPANRFAWQGVPIWEALGIEIAETHAHVYSVHSTATTITVIAHADLDCNGIQGTMTLECITQSEEVDCRLEIPAILE